MKHLFLFILLFAGSPIVAMDNPAQPDLLHQQLNGYIDPQLRNWLINMIICNNNASTLISTVDSPDSPLCKIALTPDGKTAVTVSESNSLALWNIEANTQVLLTGHTGVINDIKVVPLRNCLLSASQDCTVRLWNLATGTCLARFNKHNGPVLGIEVAAQGSVAVTRSTDHSACIWNMAANTFTQIDCYPSIFEQTLVTPDGSIVITRSAEGIVQIWDAGTGICRSTLLGHPYSSQMRWPLPNGTDDIQYFHHEDGPITKIFMSPDGKTLITSDRYTGSAYAWDIVTANRNVCLCLPYTTQPSDKYHRDYVNAIAFCPDGTTAIMSFTQEQQSRVVNLTTGLYHELFTGGFPITTTACCPNSDTIVGHSSYNTLHLWNPDTTKMFLLDCAEPTISAHESGKAVTIPEINLPLLAKINAFAPSLFGQYRMNYMPFHQYPSAALISDNGHTAVTTSAHHAFIWNLPDGTLRTVIPCPYQRAQSAQSDFFNRMWRYGTRLINKSYRDLIINSHGDCLVGITDDGKTAQAWNIGQHDNSQIFEQLSVLHIALLREIQQRIQNNAPRLILRPGSHNYQAYQSLHPIIKNIIGAHIGIYTGKA